MSSTSSLLLVGTVFVAVIIFTAKLSSVIIIIIIRSLGCWVSTEITKNWMELDLSSSDCWNVQSAQKGTRTEWNWIYHHQTVGMFSQHRREQKLNGIGFIIIRLLECSVSTEGYKNWIELDLSSSDCWNVHSAQKGTRTEWNWIGLDLSSSDCWNVQSAQKGTRTEWNWIYHQHHIIIITLIKLLGCWTSTEINKIIIVCVYTCHVRIQLIISYWNHTEGCSIFAEISPKITVAPLK